MDCINRDEKKKQVQDEGRTLSKPDKRALIAHILQERPELAAQVLSHFEPRLKTIYNADQGTFEVTDLRADREISRIYQALETQRELAEGAEAHTQAFHEDTDNIAHMSNTVVVNQLLASIPLLTLDRKATDTLHDRRRNQRQISKGFINPQAAKDLLWRLGTSYENYIADHHHLKDLIEAPLRAGQSSLTTHAEDEILYSLHQYLFGETELRYRDQYGQTRTTRSVYMESQHNPDAQVRERNNNMLTNLQVSIASVNDVSSLSHSTEQDVFKALNNGTVEIQANMNRSMAFRLFDVSEDTDGEAHVRLSEATLESMREAKVTVTPHPSGHHVVSAHLPLLDAHGNPVANAPKVWMHMPFSLSTSRRNDVAVLENMEAFLAYDPLVQDSSVYHNPHMLRQLFDLSGYSDVVDGDILADYLQNPKRTDALAELYQLAANNLLSLSLSVYDHQRDTRQLSQYSPFPERVQTTLVNGKPVVSQSTIIEQLHKAIQAITRDATPEKNQRNIAKTLQHVFGSNTDLKKVQTFVDSPLMFFVGNRQLAQQIMESRGLQRTQSQYNVNNDVVNKNTIVTNIENLHRKVGELRQLIQGRQYTVFSANPYATGRYEVEDMFRFDGYRNTSDNLGKSQMRMNEKEINHSIHRYFGESIRQNYDRQRGGAWRGDYFPEVNSDKSAFIGHSVRTEYNQFPLKTIQVDGRAVRTVDVEKLANEVLRVESQRRDMFLQQFVRTWGEYFERDTTTGITTAQLSELSVPQILQVIRNTPVPVSGTVPMLSNKYWIKGPSVNGVTYFDVKQTVAEYLEPMHPEQRYRQLLEGFAKHHKQSLAHGLTFREEHNEWLESLTHHGLQTDLVNNETGATVRQSEGRGVFVPDADSGQRVFEYAERTNEQLLRDMAVHAHPFEVAHYFNWMAVAPPISQLMSGDMFQYKGDNYHAMLSDRLKRSVQAVAPQMKLSLDETLTRPYDRRMPRHSYTLQVADDAFPLIDVLGGGRQDKHTEAYDGAALTFELAELMYQASYGGIHGLYPKASLKFIYGHTDNVTGDNQLLKYAVHRISSEWVKQGSPRINNMMRLFLGSIPMRAGQPVHVDVKIGEQLLQKTYDGSGTLHDIYEDVMHYTTGTSMNPFQVLADIMATNRNPLTGTFDLKDKYVTQLVFASGAKTGQKSVHSLSDLEAKAELAQQLGGPVALNDRDFNVVDNINMGMQLDASHHPENTTIAIVSQAVTASLLENRTPELSRELLQTLSAITEKGNADVERVLGGDLRLEDEYLVVLEGETSPRRMPLSALGYDEDGNRIARDIPGGPRVASEQLLAEKDISYEDLRLQGIELPGYEALTDKAQAMSYFQDATFRQQHGRRLFTRALALKGMDAQGIYNTTYNALEDNSFDLKDPQIEKVVTSALNTWINRKTIALKFSGGNYVVTPTYDLIHVYDAIDTETGEAVVLMRSELDNPRYAFPQGAPAGRNLKWKGFTRQGESIMARDTVELADGSQQEQYRYPVYGAFADASAAYAGIRKAFDKLTPEERATPQVMDEATRLVAEAKQRVLDTKAALQQELETGGWEVQPAEFILPYAFKKNFGLKTGMQPRDASVAFFYERLARMDMQRTRLQELLAQRQDHESRAIGLAQRQDGAQQAGGLGNAGLRAQDMAPAFNGLDEAQAAQLNELLHNWDYTFETEEAVNNLFTTLFPQLSHAAITASLAKADARLLAQAQAMHADFHQTLDAIVNRIPNSGMQSITTGRIVGFLEGNENAILIPTELMIVQGADLDIDKATVQMQAVDNKGRVYKPFRRADGSVDTSLSSAPALQNHMTTLVAAVNDAIQNAIQTQTPVAMDRLGAQKTKRESGANAMRFDPDQPFTLVNQKILTAEGKAMTGLEANGLKMFGITYFVRQATGKSLKPLHLNIPVMDVHGNWQAQPVVYNDIANHDPKKAVDQAWEIYSELVNAATDNAKEMILGAIGANLQSGNLINAMVMYGMDANTLFDFLSNPYVESVLKRMRHAGDIDAEHPTNFSVEDAIRAELIERDGKDEYEAKSLSTNELLKSSLDPQRRLVLSTLFKMGQVADEFGVGASMLAINRSLPVAMYDKFNYRQKLENHLNKKLTEAHKHATFYDANSGGTPLTFNLERFISDEKYAASMENLIADYDYHGYQTVEAVNLLSLARHAPHIKSYLKTMLLADNTLKSMAPVYAKAETIIRTLQADAKDKQFKNISQDAYGAVVRYLNEVQVHEFVKTKQLALVSTDGTPLAFDLGKNEHVSAFVSYFPDYLNRLKERNAGLKQNPFFQKLEKKTDAKGQYLHIPNIDQLSENVIFDLRFGLNNLRNNPEWQTGPTTTIPHKELLNQLFLYSLIVGKGKVSKTSFFELFEPGLKKDFGYTAFLQNNSDPLHNVATDLDSLRDNLHVQMALSELHETGNEFVLYPTRTAYGGRSYSLRNEPTYNPNPEIDPAALPTTISLYRNGNKQLYQLTGITGNRTLAATLEYSAVQPRFPVVALSANTDGKSTHSTANRVRKSITDPRQIEALLAGKEVNLDVRVPATLTQQVVHVDTNLGTVRLDRRLGKGNLMASRLQHAHSVNNQVAATAPVQVFVDHMITALVRKFPHIDVVKTDGDGMAARFGEADRNTVGMADGGTIYFNMDMAQPDMPMHEFGHIFMWGLQESNPTLYARITDLALQENGRLATQVRQLYPELEGRRLGEEIFVTMLGHKSVEELRAAYPQNSRTSWVGKLWDAMQDFFAFAKDLLADITGADRLTMRRSLEELDLSQATVWDFLNSVSYEMLNGDIRQALPQYAHERMRLRGAPQLVNSGQKLLELLITDPHVSLELAGPKAEKMQKMMSDIRRYVRNNFENTTKDNKKILDTYNKDKYSKLALNLFGDGKFDPFSDNLYTLEELRKIGEVTSMHNGKNNKVNVDFSALQLRDPNVLVRTSIVGKQVEIELIDMAGRHQKYFNQHLGNAGLAGAFVKDKQWERLGGTFKASQEHADALRLGIYAIQLQAAGGKHVRVGSVFMVNTGKQDSSKWVKGEHMSEVVANLQALLKIPQLKSSLKGDLQRMLEAKGALDPKTYEKDMLQHYRLYVQRALGWTSSNDRKKELNDLDANLSAKAKNADEVIALLSDRLAVLMGRNNNGVARNGPVATAEKKIIGETILQLSGVRNLYRTNKGNFINKMQQYIDNPAMTGVGIVDFVYSKLAAGLSRIRETVMREYKPQHNDLQDKLIAAYRQGNPLSVVEDWTINDARKFFEPLLEFTTAYDASNNPVRVWTGRLVQNDTGLSEIQKQYKRFFEAQTGRYHKEMYANKGYNKEYKTDGLVPLMRMQGSAALKDLVKDGAAGDVNWQKAKAAIGRWWDEGFNNLDYFYDNADSVWVTDPFKGQFDVREEQSPFGNETRLEMLGLVYEQGKLRVFDQHSNKAAESDLSIVLDMFVSNAARKAEFDKMVPVVEAAKSFVELRNDRHGIATDYTNEFLDDYKDRLVANRGDGDEDFAQINKVINKAGALGSLAMLGLNVTANLANFSTGFFSNYKEALYNGLIGNTGLGGQGGFSIADLTKAQIITPAQFEEMDLFNNIYGFNQLDFQSMNHDRHRASSMAKFGSKSSYWLNYIGDAYNRATLFKAQMLKDGSWKAYERQGDKIVYNEKKDPRFFNADGSQTAGQKAFYDMLKERMRQDGTLDAQGNMTRGYDDKQRNNLKYLSDKAHGSYDNELATNLNNYALGRAVLVFGKFMQNKFKTYFSGGRAGKYYSDTEGHYEEVTLPDGTKQWQWKGTWNEGIWTTVMQFGGDLVRLRKSSWSNLEPHQKRNMLYLSSDVLILTVLVNGIIAGLFGDEDENKKDSPFTAALQRGSRESVQWGLDPREPMKKIAEPMVMAVYYQKQLNNIVGALGGDTDRYWEIAATAPWVGRYISSGQRVGGYMDTYR